MPVFRTMALVAMKRLMDKEKWDRYYEKAREHSRPHPLKAGFTAKGLRRYFYSYSDYLLFYVVL